MSISYRDAPSDIAFTHYPTLPDAKAIPMFGMVRDGLEFGYDGNPKTAQDIRERKKEYHEPTESKLTKGRYSKPTHHYATAVGLDAVHEMRVGKLNSESGMIEKTECYMAIKYEEGSDFKKNRPIAVGGFTFKKTVMNGESVVYISQGAIDLAHQRKKYSFYIMQSILTHFPAGTKFIVLTRVFNDPARELYKKLGFDEVRDISAIKALGYDERYCAFRITTGEAQLSAIKANQIEFKPPVRMKFDPNRDKIRLLNLKYRHLFFGMVAAAVGIVVHKLVTSSSTSICKPSSK